MRYRITAPVKEFSNQVAGVMFESGVAETDNPGAVAYFRRHGYGVEEIGEEKPSRPAGQRPPQSAGKPEWIAYAVERGMPESDAKALNKSALIEEFGDHEVTVEEIEAEEDDDGEG
ncbi:MAG: hypothetical protein ACRDT8_00215 [Micromonosporaceae bacterium]